MKIALSAIAENGHNVRRVAPSEQEEAALRSSMAAIGQLQAVLLRNDAEAGKYIIVAGHRRVRAARAARWARIFCSVRVARRR